ncbi:head maturation protease, ClpP-related [Azospirillum griseum]|uniref:ATP-dependent Clp protease proteolytic subunit n=1 Tax=Azospirillum griseum TaxID=2496639 RepID=A0A3S0JF41_9PROT|nr:head maturation protease, ClpP-related [Azospirillum griseum]RTR16174.1 Clp protease ClpP [Azospirillum griseum]
MRTWYNMKAVADGAAEILIYDEIGAWGITANQFVQDLRGLGAVSRIDVRINSPGGEVFDGLAIYNALSKHAAEIVVTIDGIAASIASVIAMAGKDIIMPENAMMMIHDPSGGVWGTAADMRRIADALDKGKQAIISAYRRCGLADESLSQLMTDETWFSATDALEKGFCTKVEKPVKMSACFDLANLDRFRHPPAALVAALARTSALPPLESSMTDTATGGGQTPPTNQQTTSLPPGGGGQTEALPADPASIARDCLAAGLPELTPSLITAKATSAIVTARLQDAKTIKDICARAGIADQAAGLITNGATVDSARAVAFEALAARDQASHVDSTQNTPPGTNPKPRGPLNAATVYDRFNNPVRGV